MNALPPRQPETAHQRTARHMSMCAELADLAMELARDAAARARTAMAEPETPAPTAERPIEVPPAARPARPAAARKPPDPALVFVRLAKVVRDCMLLEAKLAAGMPATPADTSERPADPRHAILQDAFGHVTRHHPDRAALIRETSARLADHLAADPEQTIEIAELLYKICGELGIAIDLVTLPNKYLGMGPNDELPPCVMEAERARIRAKGGRVLQQTP